MFTQPLPVSSLKKKKSKLKIFLPFSPTLSFLPPQNREFQHQTKHFCVSIIIDFWIRGTTGNPQICTVPLSARCTVGVSLNYVKDI